MRLACVFRLGIELALDFVLALILHRLPRAARGPFVQRVNRPLNRAARRVAGFRAARDREAGQRSRGVAASRGAPIVARGVAF